MARFDPDGRFVLKNLPVYPDNATAIAAGLTTGTVYVTVAGDLRAVV